MSQKDITVADIEGEVKRALSNREISAVIDLRGQLPDDRRKRKHLIRKAREKARSVDLKDPKILATRGEPTEDELRGVLNFLATWQTPPSFASTVASVRRRIPIRKLMSRRYQPIREGIVLSTFCERRKALAVRLAENPPDGRVRLSVGDDTPVEITEALDDRKRGDEYSAGSIPLLIHVSDAELVQLTEKMMLKLEEVVEAKANKNYDPPPILLVYLNFPHDERAEIEIEETVKRLREKFAGKFKEIQVLTDRKLY